MPMTTHKLPLVLLLMMVIVSAGSLIQLQPASATFPGKNGKIAFSRNVGATTRQIQYEIFTVNPDGSGLTQLTFTGLRVFNSEPRWSADGMKIVFVSNRVTAADADGNYEIWTMNADGSGQTQLTFTPTPVFIDGPAFSPDGSKIIFASNQPPSTRINIWVMNADGSNQKRLTTSTTADDSTPVWSPDGLKIVFSRSMTGLGQIWIMNAADGSNPVDISNSPGNGDFTPEWSPDGRMIAFSRNIAGGEGAIWGMNADGSNQKKLSTPTPPESDDYPAWSPDGTKIAFARAIYASIIVMNAADGSNPVDITESQPNSGTDVTPNWQPMFANPVGGVVTPVNKIEILTPYLPLAGLIAAVSAVVAVRKRRD